MRLYLNKVWTLRYCVMWGGSIKAIIIGLHPMDTGSSPVLSTNFNGRLVKWYNSCLISESWMFDSSPAYQFKILCGTYGTVIPLSREKSSGFNSRTEGQFKMFLW